MNIVEDIDNITLQQSGLIIEVFLHQKKILLDISSDTDIMNATKDLTEPKALIKDFSAV